MCSEELRIVPLDRHSMDSLRTRCSTSRIELKKFHEVRERFGCFQKYGFYPKMDGENKGKTLLKLMIWGENPLFLETPIPRCFDRGTLLGLLPTTAAHVYAGTLAPSSSELMSLGHHWSRQHEFHHVSRKAGQLRTGSGAAMKAIWADSKRCSRWHEKQHLLSQWLTFWTFGDYIFSRENKVQTCSNCFFSVHWLSENTFSVMLTCNFLGPS